MICFDYINIYHFPGMSRTSQVLYLSFQSLLVPLRLALAMLFTLVATFGMGVLVYQTTWLRKKRASDSYGKLLKCGNGMGISRESHGNMIGVWEYPGKYHAEYWIKYGICQRKMGIHK